MTQERVDNLIQAAKRLRNEQQNACSLDHWKAELTRLRQPKVTGSAPAEFVWNRNPEHNSSIGGTGTLTGDLSAWRFTGELPGSWNGALRIAVTCDGRLDPGVSPKPNALGTMACRATWTDRGQSHEWRCQGPGASLVDSSIGYFWFMIWFGRCSGTIAVNGKIVNDSNAANQGFGVVGLKSRLALP